MPYTWEGFANAVGEMQSKERARQAEAAHEKQIEKFQAEIASLEEANAGNLAEKNALRVALAKVDPNHPLLKNASLRQQLHATAYRVLSMNKNWDDVIRYGQNFKY